MIPMDLARGFLEGVLSCLTPEMLLLLPLLPGAVGAGDRLGQITIAVGVGLSLILTGILAGSFGSGFAFEAIWLRWAACAVLLLQGLALMSPAMVERFPLLTGGYGGGYAARGEISLGGAFRLLLLALFVGANWIPLVGPTLGRASLMAADIRNSGLALPVLLIFGMGAAVPWIILGRILRILLRPVAWTVIDGMAGKRLLGLTMMVVAILGGTGLELPMERHINALLPSWAGELAMRF